jgi:serine/threonine protein kinase
VSLENIIVGTMDGKMLCLDRHSGQPLWEITTGPDLIKSSYTQLIPSLNGNLYLYHKGKLDKHPMSVYDIVSKSPFSMNDDLLYIGSKETQLYSIDPETGHAHKCTASTENPCGDFDVEGRILVMRADYIVKAVDRWSGEMKWNVSLGEFSTTSSIGLPVDGEDENDDDDDDVLSSSWNAHTPSTAATTTQHALPTRPTHGLLSAMDGTLALIDVRTGKTVWTVAMPSPAIHMQNNIYTSTRSDFVLSDLKFVPQLLLHLDTTKLKEREQRVFIGEHRGSLIAVEQLAQYNRPNDDYESIDSGPSPQLDDKDSNNRFAFPTSPETTPVALPSTTYYYTQQVVEANTGITTSAPRSYLIPQRKCSGPHDTSLECLLGIHYIQLDPCCVGDNCMCDATLRLPDKPSPLAERPVGKPNLTLGHPSFDWDSGDYDRLLQAIIIFDWYRQQLKSWPIWLQLVAPTVILMLAFYLFHRVKPSRDRKPSKAGGALTSSSELTSSGEFLASDSGSSEKRSSGRKSGFSSSGTSSPSSSSSYNSFTSSSSSNSRTLLRPSLPDSNGVVRVGKLEVLTTKILGHGSSGTIVFEGLMNGRQVAVKRMLKTFFSIAERETHVLCQTDEHPNVIRYYTTEEDSDFIYLALSFADRSLASFIEDEENFAKLEETSKKNLLHQLAHGMRHLHGINIVHRDIKPQNVLITSAGVVKISDMGLAKKLESDSLSLSTAAHGTVGWQAPELIIARVESSSEDSSINNKSSGSADGKAGGHRVKVSKRVDIFSLGCLFYYVLTRKHPFGDRLIRESNIVTNQHQLVGISSEAMDMVKSMLNPDPKLRPTAAQILEHPYFWDANKRLRFLKDASDFFEFEKPNSEVVLRFEAYADRAAVIPGMNWVAQLPEELLSDLNKFRKYNGAKLRDLLRVIRNKAHHYRDLPPEAQATFGQIPEGFLDYFCKTRFPDLLTFTWNYARRHYSVDKVFSEYFPYGSGPLEPIEEIVIVLPEPPNQPSTAKPTAAATSSAPPTTTTTTTSLSAPVTPIAHSPAPHHHNTASPPSSPGLEESDHDHDLPPGLLDAKTGTPQANNSNKGNKGPRVSSPHKGSSPSPTNGSGGAHNGGHPKGNGGWKPGAKSNASTSTNWRAKS